MRLYTKHSDSTDVAGFEPTRGTCLYQCDEIANLTQPGPRSLVRDLCQRFDQTCADSVSRRSSRQEYTSFGKSNDGFVEQSFTPGGSANNKKRKRDELVD